MGEYRNILVAYDGSDSSRNALEQAKKISKGNGCGVAAVIVVNQRTGSSESPEGEHRDELASGPQAKLVAELEKTIKGCTEIRTVQLEGSIYEAIIDVARSRNSDLIVMGRRGITGLERVFMGSVTARVIGYSPVDVLVVPHDATISLENVLLATDGSRYSNLAAEKALNIARSYRARLKAVSVIDVPAEFFATAPDIAEKLNERARNIVEPIKREANVLSIEADVFVRSGITHEQIVRLADEVGAGLILVGSHGKTGLERFLMGSVTEKVIGSARCPVLVVKSG